MLHRQKSWIVLVVLAAKLDSKQHLHSHLHDNKERLFVLVDDAPWRAKERASAAAGLLRYEYRQSKWLHSGERGYRILGVGGQQPMPTARPATGTSWEANAMGMIYFITF
jgi:hypothetical protein